MKSLAIGECIKSIQKWDPAKEGVGETFRYIDISSISQDEKIIIPNGEILTSEAPSRARQLIKSGDVLVSTVRPNLNAVALVPKTLDGATASTGFCVLRADQQRLDGCYLFHWVRTNKFVAEMVKQATGQSYPAVSDKIVKDSLIPLPPLAEQKRIAAILDQANSLRRLRQRAIDRLNTLGQAIFYEMFGDPAINPKGWPIGTIESLTASTQYGTSAKAGDDGAFPILRMGNITESGVLDFSSLKYIDLPVSDIEKYTVRDGDILFNRTNSPDLVGKTGVYRGATIYAFAGYLVRLRTNDKSVPEYIGTYLNSPFGKRILRGMCKAIIGMANINAKELRTIPIPLPPIDLQREFQQKIIVLRSTLPPLERHRRELEMLFTSLQHRAFRGEL